MSRPDTDTLRPAASEYWWWTFTPLYSALFIIGSISTNVISSEAASYTLLLTAIYVPAVLVLRRRARALIPKEQRKTDADGEKWLEENGLNITASLKTLLPKLAAILAPLLVGAVGELIKGINVIPQ